MTSFGGGGRDIGDAVNREKQGAATSKKPMDSGMMGTADGTRENAPVS